MNFSFKNFYESYAYDALEYYMEKYNEHLYNIVTDFTDGVPKIKWNRIPAPRFIKIWKDFGKTGIIRDERGLNTIKYRMLNNIIRLDVTNMLSGHDIDDPKHRLEELDINLDLDDPEIGDKFYYEYLTGDDSGFVSDYGLPKLKDLFSQLYNEQDPEKILFTIDKMLNIIHQRSDLSAVFIEGGQSTLNQIFEYTGKDIDDE